MSDYIPYELLMGILPKVPAEALLRFRCVCKAWCRMIDDPYLINIHRDHQLLNIHDFSNGVSRLFMVNNDKQICCSSLNTLLLSANNYGPKCFGSARIITYPMMFHGSSFVTCNGLVLVLYFSRDGIKHRRSIMNPLTQEVHVLPYDDDDGVESLVYGFGYDSASDDYKVLTHSSTSVGGVHTRRCSLYSLKSNSWKRINYDSSHWISHCRPGVFSNGALHWIGGRRLPETRKSSFMIVAFDLTIEDFRYYSLPASIFIRLSPLDLEIGELGGCLSLSGHLDMVHLETWLMNDYGDEKSWSLLFTIAESESNAYLIRPISYSKNKGLVLLQKRKNKGFLLFDLKNRTAGTVSIPNGLNIDYPGIFVASHVRINASKKERELSG